MLSNCQCSFWRRAIFGQICLLIVVRAFLFPYRHQRRVVIDFGTRSTGICPILDSRSTRSMAVAMVSSEATLMEAMSSAASKSLGRDVRLEPSRGGGSSGGGGAQTSAAVDANTGNKYFIKSAPVSNGGGKMLRAEYLSVQAMADTETIKVPDPVAYGEGGPMNTAFVVFEYLDMDGFGGDGRTLGKQLARMHRSASGGRGFGFDVDNTIGATPQPNLPWIQDWAEFWDLHRLGHMLKLTGNAGMGKAEAKKLREKTKVLLSHNPEPSLLHGDLWGGNKGYARVGGETVPVIFDPATYYGDREADIAMTYLFGGFGADFYAGYEAEWPLPEGHEKRKTVYNLYHILNHYVLFGGGYLGQARGMIQRILSY